MVTQFQNENKNITWAQDFPRHLSIWNCPQQMGNSNSEQWPSFLTKGKLGTYHDRALRTFLKRRRKRYTYITAAKALLYTGSRWQKHYKWVAPAKGKEHTKVEGESLKGCVEWINLDQVNKPKVLDSLQHQSQSGRAAVASTSRMGIKSSDKRN